MGLLKIAFKTYSPSINNCHCSSNLRHPDYKKPVINSILGVNITFSIHINLKISYFQKVKTQTLKLTTSCIS